MYYYNLTSVVYVLKVRNREECSKWVVAKVTHKAPLVSCFAAGLFCPPEWPSTYGQNTPFIPFSWKHKQEAVTHKGHHVLSTFNSLSRAYSKDVEFALKAHRCVWRSGTVSDHESCAIAPWEDSAWTLKLNPPLPLRVHPCISEEVYLWVPTPWTSENSVDITEFIFSVIKREQTLWAPS